MQQIPYIFSLEIAVRDYELDSQGIVNNAIYQHYFEHTRHAFCRQAGISFAAMHQLGIDPVVRRIEIKYLQPLRSGDVMRSCLALRRHGPLFVFVQDIYVGDTPIAKATVDIACIVDGALTRGNELLPYFEKYLMADSQ